MKCRRCGTPVYVGFTDRIRLFSIGLGQAVCGESPTRQTEMLHQIEMTPANVRAFLDAPIREFDLGRSRAAQP